MYQNRLEAAARLAELLSSYTLSEDTLVLGLARGGILIAHEIGKLLQIPFDLVLTRKIGAPGNPELAIGAIAGEAVVWNNHILKQLGISKEELERLLVEKQKEAEAKLLAYRLGKEALPLENKRVILVDDGIATGSTMEAAIKHVKSHHPKELIVAVPVAPPGVVQRFETLCDRFVCPLVPEMMWAVGQFYQEFSQVEDEEIIKLMEE